MPLKKTSSSEKSGEPPVAAGVVEAGEAPAKPCLVVAIGASAGGQEALEQLFTAMPADCGVSFVVVMHLPPGGPSFLAEMLGRYTTMEVVTAEEGMPLVRNRVHVIPPGRGLTMDGDRLLLHLEGSAEPHRPHHPIDRLFRSLAQAKGKDAIAVVLSGFGIDGTEGIKAVSAAGGIVIVQEPASAGSPAMPLSAIATGAAGLILPAEEIPVKIAELARGACSLSSSACRPTSLEEELHTIFAIVKAKTGHDFSSYKANTVLRRIERRMAVNDAGGIGKYIALLRENPHEAHALCQDILIGVTSFFRDPEAFDTLRREIVPRLFADRDPDEPVRIWHACCATGEEVYSMAMLIREYLDEHRLAAKVQLFATDIDEVAIAQARAGQYDDDIVAGLGEERLKIFFTRGDGHWQVAKSLREMVVFAHHSLIKDPPFSRLDLLVCRNFLIYLNPDMQKRLISLFHQVLKPGGFLFLGSAESVGHQSGLFAAVDKKWKIYARREGAARTDKQFPQYVPVRLPGKYRPASHAGAGELTPGAIGEKFLMERYALPSAVVNEKYEAVHLFSRTSPFLEMPNGEPTRDIMKMAREELRPALRAAIYKGFAEPNEVVFRGVKVGDDGDGVTINVLAKQLKVPPSVGKLLIVIFEPVASPAVVLVPTGGEEAVSGGDASRELLIRQLEEQLHVTHEQLQATTEQLETSNEGFLSTSEELMSINEEFQSANEELQSTNEELETSKEELQALNEELATVNSELQGKVEELNQTTSNMENLLASSEIATIFLDRLLNLKGFTPAAAAIFNLIPSDDGRPFRHFAGRIDWPGFINDAETVLAGQPFTEREVTTLDSERCYLKRIFPYRTQEGKIDGIVVTLIDITDRKRMEERTRHLASFPQLNPNPVLELDLSGRIKFCSPAASLFMESCGRENDGFGSFLFPDFDAILRELAGESGKNIYREIAVKDRVFGLSVHLVPQFSVVRVYAFDITEQKQSELAILRAKQEWERTFDSVPDLIAVMDARHRIIRVNNAMADRLGKTPDECQGLACYTSIHGADGPPEHCPHSMTLADGREHVSEVHEDRLGGDFLVTTTPLTDEQGLMIGTVHIARDITEQKRVEIEKETAVEFLGLLNESTTTQELIKSAANFFQKKSGCEALGIRLRKGEDYPYYEVRGFSQEFVHLENELCSRDAAGDIIRDSVGNPIIDCMCGNVICERFDPSKPFFTPNGSFWSNSTTELLDSTSEADRQARTRNRCNGEGYESVALIPLSFGNERLGLLQLNDRRKGMFTPQGIALWERLAGYLAVALTKFRAEEALQESERRYSALFANKINAMAHCRVITDENGRPVDYLIMKINEAYEQLIGIEKADIEGHRAKEVFPGVENFAFDYIGVLGRVGLEGGEILTEAFLDTTRQYISIYAYSPLPGEFTAMFTDVTERKHGEIYRSMGQDILLVLNENENQKEAIKRVIDIIKSATGVDAVGIRLQDEDDFPYFYLEGFPQDFLLKENSLLTRTKDGGICRDEDGNVCLECTCGLVVTGKTDPSSPLFTKGGSSWTNDSFPFLHVPVDEDIRTNPRNECIHQGFASVALIPIRAKGRVVGLLQLNDRRKGCFTLEGIKALEKIAENVGESMLRKQAEEALLESEKQFRTLADAIPQLCWTANADGWITWYNQRWYEYTGTTPEQMEGWGWQSVHDPEVLPNVMERWQVSIATGKPFDMVFPLLGADNVFRPFLTRIMPVCDQDGKVVRWFGTNTDISDRKRAEEDLQQAKEAAEAANRVKSQFLANMSHELRTPMTGVLGMLDLALTGDLEEEQREFICAAHASAYSLVRILNDILDLTKIERGILTIEEEPFSIRKCVENTFNILLPVAKRKGLELNFTMADDVPETMSGDQTRLNQILTNLAGNAVKFTEEGKVEISVAAGGRAPEGRRAITFTVTDTGIGIPEGKKELLFREFSQVDDSHSRTYGGTGLGLAISKEIVERMGGEITFTSEEGKGSAFSFCIPFGEAETVREVEIAPEKTAKTEAAPPSEERNKPRLLLAEDDPTIRMMLQVMLQRSNYEIGIAENGQEAVEMWEKGNHDLILMDVQMPRMNGFEATGAIREKERSRGGHIPIMAMTAHSLKEDELRCFAAGMDAYISKPIDFRACLQLIEETLKKSGVC